MKIVFFGSSDFSLAALQTCLQNPHQVVQVITTPAKPQGRGLKETPNPVQTFSQAHHLSWIAPTTLKNPEVFETVQSFHPELFVVSSYGKMIPDDWLKIPSILALNVHPSLLPKYRGASPLHWPILNGDMETGISIAEVTRELDAGDVFYQKHLAIQEGMSSLDLEKALAQMSRDALLAVFSDIEKNQIKRTSQIAAQSCYARKLSKSDSVIHWNQSARQIANQIHGLLPWPVANTLWNQLPLQILAAKLLDPQKKSGKAGEILSIQKNLNGFEIQTGEGSLVIQKVKPSGKKEMSGMDFINGNRLTPGYLFSNS